jgi:hypothetical protein
VHVLHGQAVLLMFRYQPSISPKGHISFFFGVIIMLNRTRFFCANLLSRVVFPVLLCLVVQGCPQAPAIAPITPIVGFGGAYILCEGLWRQDNATLSRFDNAKEIVQNDYFASVNPSLRLGDTANDMVLKGDTLYIAVSTSRSIEILQASSGKWLGRIRLNGMKQEPRCLSIVNDTTAFCTNLNDDSITEFNPRTFTIRTARIPVGPAPEGIAATNRYVFVANSGFGDFRASEPKAGTVSVLDVQTKQERRILTGLPNVSDIAMNRQKTRLYAAYRHLPSKIDSLGGIAEFDAETLQELRRWRMKSPLALNFSATGDTLFYVSDGGVDLLAIRQLDAKPTSAVRKTDKNVVWYGLGVHPRSSALWICNAKDYSSQGEIIVMQTGSSAPIRRFEVGINPNTIVFF